jgi:hypothetical protein
MLLGRPQAESDRALECMQHSGYLLRGEAELLQPFTILGRCSCHELHSQYAAGAEILVDVRYMHVLAKL